MNHQNSIPSIAQVTEENFKELRQLLTNSNQLSYAEFKKTLKPNYFKVWLDISLGWILLASSFTAAAYLIKQDLHWTLIIAVVLGAALAAGYWIAYLVNFLHEAAHFNIARKRPWNDRLSNLFIGVLTGQDVKSSRAIHWLHHKHLGTPEDSEISYFSPLNIRFLAEAITGIRVLKVILIRSKHATGNNEPIQTWEKWMTLIWSLAFHAGMLCFFYFLVSGYLCISWILAFGCFYPLFNSLRQLLEHRDDQASKKNDYTKIPHGKLTRIFGNNPLDASFGSAGFNKHLLHHLEPQISYTRLNDLQRFLEDSQVGTILKKQITHYPETFRKLFNH